MTSSVAFRNLLRRRKTAFDQPIIDRLDQAHVAAQENAIMGYFGLQ